MNLDIKTIITTNYDEFLERNFDYYSGGQTAYNVCKQTSPDFLNQIRSQQRTIAKIHGCITEPNGIILDRMSYFSAKQHNSGFYSIVSSLFTTNTVLFMGYSIGDPDLQIILENINAVYSSTNGHYALVEKMEHPALVKSMKHSFNITCIEYPNGNHQLVPKYIEIFKDEVYADRAGRGVR